VFNQLSEVATDVEPEVVAENPWALAPTANDAIDGGRRDSVARCVKHAEVVTARLVRDERGLFRLAV